MRGYPDGRATATSEDGEGVTHERERSLADHLTPLDAAFLELEEGDEGSHMHIGWAMIFAPLPDGGTPPLEAVRRLSDRLERLPRFSCRRSSTRTGRGRWPTWEADADFDVAAHVRRASLPA